MDDLIIMCGVGFGLILLGVLLLRHEKRVFKDSVISPATVVAYYNYQNYDGPTVKTMYTMAVEYIFPDGKLIHASEQSGSDTQGFPLGQQISITYSTKKPEMFVVTGDSSRKNVMIGIIAVGILIVVFITYFGIKSYFI